MIKECTKIVCINFMKIFFIHEIYTDYFLEMKIKEFVKDKLQKYLKLDYKTMQITLSIITKIEKRGVILWIY